MENRIDRQKKYDAGPYFRGKIEELYLDLTLHQIGVPVHIFESTRNIKPLGVGINLQPTAVRELMEMGLNTNPT